MSDSERVTCGEHGETPATCRHLTRGVACGYHASADNPEDQWRMLGPLRERRCLLLRANAMDMWEAYASLLRAIVDDADDKIVFDRFHIVAHMNDAVDKIRRRENKQLRADDDDRLVGSKHLWLYGRENRPDAFPVEVRTELTKLRDSNLKTARAWALKESLREGISAAAQLASAGGRPGTRGPPGRSSS